MRSSPKIRNEFVQNVSPPIEWVFFISGKISNPGVEFGDWTSNIYLVERYIVNQDILMYLLLGISLSLTLYLLAKYLTIFPQIHIRIQ